MNITKNDKERMLEYHRIAVESKMIVEGIQKTLGVFTTTEALQKIVALKAVAEASRVYKMAVEQDEGEYSDAYWVDGDYRIVPDGHPSAKWFLTKLDIATRILENALKGGEK